MTKRYWSRDQIPPINLHDIPHMWLSQRISTQRYGLSNGPLPLSNLYPSLRRARTLFHRPLYRSYLSKLEWQVLPLSVVFSYVLWWQLSCDNLSSSPDLVTWPWGTNHSLWWKGIPVWNTNKQSPKHGALERGAKTFFNTSKIKTVIIFISICIINLPRRLPTFFYIKLVWKCF